MLGGITIANTGTSPCYLQGYLRVSLLDQEGRPLAVELSHRGTIGTAGLNGPVVLHKIVLAPGRADSGAIGLRWSNWCGPEPGVGGSVGVELMLAGGTLAVPHGANPWEVTTCSNPKLPSVLEEGPVQRPTS